MVVQSSTRAPDSAEIPPVHHDDGVSRRSVLRGLGLGAVTVVVAGTGALSYRTLSNGVLDAGSGGPYDPWSHWRDDAGPLGTVGAAILAANPHDSQPWTFRVTPNAVEVYADRSRLLGSVDPYGREQHIGMGCALENLVLAAVARGFAPTVSLLPQPADPTHVATVALVAGAAGSSPLYEAIGSRHSNRGPYTTKAVSAETLQVLAGGTAELADAEVRWFSTPAEMSAMSALIIDATAAIVGDEQQSLDGFAWFRNNRSDIDAHRDGLTLDAQGLPPLTLALAKLLPESSRAAGDKFWLDQTRTVHTKTAAAYGVITVVDPADPAQRLTGGRLLERVHLTATSAGVALQHMNQITERTDRDRSLGKPAAIAGRMDGLLDRPGRHVLSTFRVGYAVRAARLSPRRPLIAVIR